MPPEENQASAAEPTLADLSAEFDRINFDIKKHQAAIVELEARKNPLRTQMRKLMGRNK